MAFWFLIFFSLSLCLSLTFLLTKTLSQNHTKKKNLPPGPPTLPFLGNPMWLRKSFFDIETHLRALRSKYGPIMTIHMGPRPAIFITNSTLIHEALVQKGASFADRPLVHDAARIITSNQHNISWARYGPLWRLLRRNLITKLLNLNQIEAFSPGREWVLKLLIKNLKSESKTGNPIIPLENLRHAMFCLLLFMCFGQKVDENLVRDIEAIHRTMLLRFFSYNIFLFFPKIGKFVFRRLWNELLEMKRRQEELYVPLIRARREKNPNDDNFLFCYADSLLPLELSHEGGRKLTDKEIVTLCAELLDGGTDTTSTTLQWIMANLVKHQEIQKKLFEEIKGVIGEEEKDTIKEEDLQKMPYLKAVIMEGLRRHPPGHFLLAHAVSEDVSIDGYVIPKGTMVNFLVREIGLDKTLWKDPMEFKPERFLEGEEVDITGSREMKMIPFGMGRRICPGLGLAILHLEYFVANLVNEFEWKAKDGEGVDLSEKQEFTIVMKNPLQAIIIPRRTM
ncbi:cytochrome P450 89A2-like [Tasmannia lanceolata]|uniref:cytochrome P450 89A2-like n=1 Tax=Tasmannia lanceolata TaxID=3420 RepID=UPI00406419B6